MTAICPTCKVEGLKSVIRTKGADGVRLPCDSFYDENGYYHQHDLKGADQAFSCSNGHEGIIRTFWLCMAPGCQFGRDRTVVEGGSPPA
jgi:hypothetical protein